mmetsp:Transcript_4829/g.7304  ORF Transcript_4829/g.7304 Transcript_4829/m.7304 type:complete len:458 (-) Transcript_4829:1067-2440(-)
MVGDPAMDGMMDVSMEVPPPILVEMGSPPSAGRRSPASASPASPQIKVLEDRLRHQLSSCGVDITSPPGGDNTPKKFVERQEPMLVLQFLQDGSYSFLHLRRDDIMQNARKVIPHVKDTDPRLERERKTKENTEAKVPEFILKNVSDDRSLKERVRLKGTLQNRDIRLLDKSFTGSQDPGIRVRRHAIIVNLDPIKALILYDRCLIFVPDGADSILSTLMERMRGSKDTTSQEIPVSFVMKSLECIFITVCNSLSQEVEASKPYVTNTVNEIIRKSSGVTIEKLRQCKSSVSKLASRLVGVQRAFEELLLNDRDMALMDLNKVQSFPEYYDDKNEEVWSIDHEDVELLIENYSQAIDGSYSQVCGLKQEIESAISTITLRLDTARNKLLGVDLLVTSVTSAAAVGALFAGLFGMNLKSGVEEEPYWFWTWFTIIIAGVPLMVTVMFYAIYKQGLLIT